MGRHLDEALGSHKIGQIQFCRVQCMTRNLFLVLLDPATFSNPVPVPSKYINIGRILFYFLK